jgi:hypothetical protein
MARKNPAAVALGRLGGKVKSAAKTLAARANAKKKRRRIMKTAIVLTALLLTGCAGHVWVKDGATAADFERDMSGCMFQTAAAGDPIFAALFLPDCLRGRGYTQQKKD